MKYPSETAWLEFKRNNDDPQEIGEYISALSNAAALEGKAKAYVLWGIDSRSQNIVGTRFQPATAKKGNQPLESWLLQLLQPRIHFRFDEVSIDECRVVILEIDRAAHRPVAFSGREYIRVGEVKKPLKEAPEIERQLWRIFDATPFEELIAMEPFGADIAEIAPQLGEEAAEIAEQRSVQVGFIMRFAQPEKLQRVRILKHLVGNGIYLCHQW